MIIDEGIYPGRCVVLTQRDYRMWFWSSGIYLDLCKTSDFSTVL